MTNVIKTSELEDSMEFVEKISYEKLLIMHGDFRPKHDYLTDYIHKLETKSIWFEMDDSFKEFLTGLLDPENEVSGLRVYLCNYMSGTIPPDVPDAEKDNYFNKLTVGMVGTKHAGGDYHPDHPDATGNKKFLAIDPYNHGKICPPDYCPGGGA